MNAGRNDFDAITFEVIRNALDSLADEIALVLMRSAYSPVVRDSMDYSTALCDRDGNIVAQGLTTALHLGSFPEAMRVILATYRAGSIPATSSRSMIPMAAAACIFPISMS